MKLLLDQNLPRSLVARISPLFPDSSHVVSVGLDRAADMEIWEFARLHGFAIVSKDGDFHQMSFLHGAPPKVIWMRLGNGTVATIESKILASAERISSFLADEEDALLTIE